MDRRVRKTKKQIRKAFVELVKDIGLSNITVSNISEKADINRGTFYLHYRNIHDLVEKLQNEIVNDLHQITKPLDPNTVIDDKDVLTPLLVDVTDKVADHADIIKALVGSQGAPSFRVTWEQIMSNLVFEKMREVNSPIESYIISENYLAVLISSIYTGIILEWIETGMNEPVEQIAEFVSEFGIQPIIDKHKQLMD